MQLPCPHLTLHHGQNAVACRSPYRHAAFAVTALLPAVTVAPPTLVADMRSAFDNEAQSDMQIIVGGRPIHVHSFVLKLRCEKFALMEVTQCAQI